LDKPSRVRELVKEHHVDFLGLQETQLSNFPQLLASKYWGNSPMEWVVVNAVGRSGGILSVWDPSKFRHDEIVSDNHFILVSGIIQESNCRLNIFNIYAPCSFQVRRPLWDTLLSLRSSRDGLWVALGDFNEVCSEDERLNSIFNPLHAIQFNLFISNMGFVEYIMSGHRFTYMSDGGDRLSKLDRIFVDMEFMSRWPGASLLALDRLVSDHTPLVLKTTSLDFGPIPFKFFNSWLGLEGLNSIVNGLDTRDFNVFGFKTLWAILKSLRVKIKAWRADMKRLEDGTKQELGKSIDDLEKLAERRVLSGEERALRADMKQRLTKMSLMKAEDLLQKSRAKWIKAGDENTAFFHGIINRNTARNRIGRLFLNGAWIEDPNMIKNCVQGYFKSKFNEPVRRRPLFDNPGLSVLSQEQASSLVSSFSPDEIKRAVWDCDGSKAP
jgi:endonuclease/exonuclease/phosphatase family metal-dependent hydrolase